jgi:pimeloyl-ACP methyl ester carboxylesterase
VYKSGMRSLPRLFGAACVVTLIAGCTGQSADSTDAPAPVELVAGDVPSCWPATGQAFRGTTEDDAVTVAVLGEGTQGIVLAPQSGQSLCNWADQAQRLADEGYVVASFVWPRDGTLGVRAAADALELVGVEEYVLMGASRGGAYVAGMSTMLDPEPLGVISISPPASYGIDARYEVVGFTGPILVIASTNDRSVGVETSREVARPDDPDSFVVLSGTAHGLALFDGEHKAEVEGLVDEFLAEAFGG